MPDRDDLISRAAALDVLVTSPNFHTTLTRIEELPAVDAIPVEWLVNLKNEYAREGREQAEGDLMNLLLMWQKEQEAQK